MRPICHLALSSVAASLLLVACATPVAPAAPPVTTAWQQQALDDIRILSADDMGGRDTGSAGGQMARDYIVGRWTPWVWSRHRSGAFNRGRPRAGAKPGTASMSSA